MFRKETIKKDVTVTGMSELLHIKRKGKGDLFKRVLDVVTDDGQVFYAELRNSKLKLFEQQGIETGCRASLEFVFQGSQKQEKKYNNIYITDIKRLS